MPLRAAKKKATVSYRNARGGTNNVRVLSTQPATPDDADFTLTPQTTGGSLADATYSYRVSVVVDGVESAASTAKTAEVSGGGGSGSVDVDATDLLAAFPGLTSWKLYGRTASSEELIETVAAPTATTTDDGTETPDGTPLAANNATRFRNIGTKTVQTQIPLATTVKDTDVYLNR